jgi:hypothetical protein
MNCNPGDILHLQLSKSDRKVDAGLKLEERHGRIYMRKVSGLVKRRELPVSVGDELLTLNGVGIADYDGINDIKVTIKNEVRISFSIRKGDPDDSESSYEDEAKHFQEQDENVKLIQPGDHYYLDGLKSKEYNGERVEVIQAAANPGRWEVEVLSSGAVLSVPEEKLAPLEEHEQTDDDEDDEDDDDVDDDDDYGAADAEYLLSVEGKPVSPGDTMKLRGIKKKAKMNGTVVTALKLNKKNKDWKVELPDGDTISIPSHNLRHVAVIL